MKRLFETIILLAVSAVLFVGCSCNPPKPSRADITGIVIAQKPVFLDYDIGGTLSTRGMVVEITYSDNSKRKAHVFDNTDPDFGTWGFSGFDSSQEGTDIPVTVSYEENGVVQTAEFKVNVRDASAFSGIEIFKKPSRVTYEWENPTDTAKFSTEGLVVKINLNSGTAVYADDFSDTGKWNITGFDTTAKGTNTITVTYKSTATATVDLSITAAITGVTVTPPLKDTYFVGDTLDLSSFANMEVVLNYADSSSDTFKFNNNDIDFTSETWELKGFSLGNKFGNASPNFEMKIAYNSSDKKEWTGSFYVKVYYVEGLKVHSDLADPTNHDLIYFAGETDLSDNVKNTDVTLTVWDTDPDFIDPATATCTFPAGAISTTVTVPMKDCAVTGFPNPVPDSDGTYTIKVAKIMGNRPAEDSFSIATKKLYEFNKGVVNDTTLSGSVGNYSQLVPNIGPSATVTNATYVLFGDYPQTIKGQGADGKDVTVYDSATNEPRRKEQGGMVMYLGSDAQYYVEATEKRAEEGTGVADRYKYSDGTIVSLASENKKKWFKVEPIKWRVLDLDYNNSGNALLFAETVTDGGTRFYETPAGNNGIIQPTRISGDNFTSAPTLFNGLRHSNWKYSSIRAYLNGSYESDDVESYHVTKTHEDQGFLQKAFTTEAAAQIKTTTVVNTYDSAKVWYYENMFTASFSSYNVDGRVGANNNYLLKLGGEYSFAATIGATSSLDKIFLLSTEEITNKDLYGFINTQVDASIPPYSSKEPELDVEIWKVRDPLRQRQPSDYALANRVKKWSGTFNGNATYWTRSACWSYNVTAACVVVGGDGKYFGMAGHGSYQNGEAYALTNTTTVGIAPALCVDATLIQ